MKSKQKTTKAKKPQVKVRDINPKKSPTGGRKRGHKRQEYYQVKFDAPLISGINPGP